MPNDAPAAPKFDLSKYEIADSAVFTFLNLAGNEDLLGEDGNPVTVELYSSGSKQGIRALHQAGQKSQLRLQGIMRGKTSKTAAQEAEAERVDKLVAFTKQISSNFPLSPHEIYSNPKLGWMTRQVEAWIGDDANFSKSSTES